MNDSNPHHENSALHYQSEPLFVNATSEDFVPRSNKSIINVKSLANVNLIRVNTVRISPYGRWRRSWDFMIVCCVLYISIVIPVRICFQLSETLRAFIFDRFIDIAFITDLILNFNTGIIVEDPTERGKTILLMERKQVRRLYLKTWFPIDFVSSIPFEVILTYIFDVNAGDQNAGKKARSAALVLRSLKLARLLKSLRILKVWEYIEQSYLIGLDFGDIIRFLTFMLFLFHWSACLFFAIDLNICRQNIERSIFWSTGMEYATWGDHYIAS